MWWKLLVIIFIVLALNVERESNSITTFYKVEMDSLHVSKSLCQSWEKFYASQQIKFGRIVFSQYTWETNWGSSKIFKENHNGYGMKYRKIANYYLGRNKKTGEIQYALGVKNGHAYYRNHADSVKDYAQWQKKLLRSRPDVDSEEKYLQMLDDYNVRWCPNCRYAEDKTYTDKIRARLRYLDSL